MTWVLIVVFHVNSGAVATFQEFNDSQSCVKAADWVRSFKAGLEGIGCFPKGEKK